MKFLKTKLVIFLALFIGIVFFSNDFGIIDIERTAIITAVAIDYDGEKQEYQTTVQIAVPEATDVNTENTKTLISTTGDTVASSIRQVGANSGWFPQLYFCNLVILGNELSNDNCIKILDYFAKTLRVQDSASVILSEGKAKELLTKASPLDSMASFAIQKVILKQDGFNRDVMLINVKDFAKNYYSINSSSYMPLVSVETQPGAESPDSQNSQGSEQSSGSGSDSGSDKPCLFNGKRTALFYNGIKVGVLSEKQTFAYNLITKKCVGSDIVVENVNENGETKNYLAVIDKNKYKRRITVENDVILYSVDLKIKMRIGDQTAEKSDESYVKDTPIPEPVKAKVIKKLKEDISSLLETSKETNCDFLRIEENMYRFHTKDYEELKGRILENTIMSVNVEII